jgi:RNA polymerase sigma-70 factor (ECF subfamily)
VSLVRSDPELLRAHLDGDRGAFAELVDRHRRYLWSIARRSLDSTEDAAEAVQDALLRAHQGAAGYRSEATVRSWLVRIVVNVCLDKHRHNRARPAVPVTGVEFERLPTPRDPIADLELHMFVQRALAELPVEQRMVIVLVDLIGYPVGEVADILEIPPGTVKSRGARGRARLAELLRPAVREPVGEAR